MAPRKTIYVREGDQGVWEKAEAIAGESLSGVIAIALRQYLAEREAAADPSQAHRIVVTVQDRFSERPTRKAFKGVYLIKEYGRWWHAALTPRGSVAVWHQKEDEAAASWFKVYDDFVSLSETEDVPEEVVAAIAVQVGSDYAEELDI